MNVDILTVHYGNEDWTVSLLKKLQISSGLEASFSIRSIMIADNAREAAIPTFNQLMPSIVKVYSFDPEQRQIETYGHDHAASITQLIARSQGDIVVLFDNDAQPINSNWCHWLIKKLRHADAVLASDPKDTSKSHPCFMAFSRACLKPPFDFDTFRKDGNDVGRSIAKTLRARGLKVEMLKSEPAFSGIYGNIYDNAVYHHGSASFSHNERLRDQHSDFQKFVRRFLETRVIKKGRYHRSLFDRAALGLGKHLFRLKALTMKSLVNIN